ncbi:MAG: hypothetical protein ACI3YE_04375 [Candidatus Avispirillum sp.]
MKRTKLFLLIGVVVAIAATGLIVFLILHNARMNKDDPKIVLQQSIDNSLAIPYELTQDENTPEYITTIERMSKYEILEINQSDGITIAKVKVSAPDLYSVALGMETEVDGMGEDEIMASVNTALKDAPVLEIETELLFEEIDGEYRPILTSEFLDAYYGGVLRLKEKVFADYMQEAE